MKTLTLTHLTTTPRTTAYRAFLSEPGKHSEKSPVCVAPFETKKKTVSYARSLFGLTKEDKVEFSN